MTLARSMCAHCTEGVPWVAAKSGSPPSGFVSNLTWALVPDLRLACALAAVSLSFCAVAQTNQDDALTKCREIVDATDRLRCYDDLAAAAQRLAPPSLATPPLPAPLDRGDHARAEARSIAAEDRSLLSQRWELEKEDKYGTFKFPITGPTIFCRWSFQIASTKVRVRRLAQPTSLAAISERRCRFS